MPVLSVTAPFRHGIDVERFLNAFRALGCTSCQFFRDAESAPTDEEAKRISDAAGLPYDSIHGWYGNDYDPASLDDRFRTDTLFAYEQEGERAALLGAPMIVIHPSGKIPGLTAPALPDDHADQRAAHVKQLQRSLETLAAVGEEMGVVYLIENLPPYFWVGDHAVQLAGWIREIESPAVRMCFDIGHAHMTAEWAGPVEEQLAQCVDVLSYVHVHDNDGTKDDHRLPGDGTVDWSGIASVLAQEAPSSLHAMIEVFHQADEIEARAADGLAERLARSVGIT